MTSFFNKACDFIDVTKSPLTYIGPIRLPLNIFVNLQKGLTLPVMFLLMIYFNNFSLGAWVYLSLHGSYGIMWVTKDVIWPDKGFQEKVGLIVLAVLIVILLLYWGIGFIMMAGYGENNPSGERIFVCVMLYVIGLVLMMCSDLQKYITLKYKKGLIDDMFFKNNRNTNYFGEILLYSSFAILTNNKYSFLFLLTVWSAVFVSRINIKERSLMKKDGYSKYKENSYLILFKFFASDSANILLYGSIVVGSYYLYTIGGIQAFVNLLNKAVKFN